MYLVGEFLVSPRGGGGGGQSCRFTVGPRVNLRLPFLCGI
jgi:hypothetical protein